LCAWEDKLYVLAGGSYFFMDLEEGGGLLVMCGISSASTAEVADFELDIGNGAALLVNAGTSSVYLDCAFVPRDGMCGGVASLVNADSAFALLGMAGMRC
jgi:hypothetical protein